MMRERRVIGTAHKRQTQQVRGRDAKRRGWAHLVESHSVLDEEGDARVEIPHVALKHEILLGLGTYARLELTQTLLCCKIVSIVSRWACGCCGPLARSSSISTSCSARMEKRWLTEYRFVFRFERLLDASRSMLDILEGATGDGGRMERLEAVGEW